MSLSVVTALPTTVCALYIYCKLSKKEASIEGHQVHYYSCGLMGCFLAAAIELLRAADGLTKGQVLPQTGKACFYMHVTHTSLYEWLGCCILLASIDALYLVCRNGRSRSKFNNKNFVKGVCLLTGIFVFVFNCLTDLCFDKVPDDQASCSSFDIVDGPAMLASKFNIGVLVWLISQLLVTKGFFAYKLLCQRFQELQLKTQELYQTNAQGDPLMMDEAIQTSFPTLNWTKNAAGKTKSSEQDENSLTHNRDRKDLLERFQAHMRSLWVSFFEDGPDHELQGETNHSFDNSDEVPCTGVPDRNHVRRSNSCRHNGRRKSAVSITSQEEGDNCDEVRVRKRSAQMLYTIENFFVIDPDRVCSVIDSDHNGKRCKDSHEENTVHKAERNHDKDVSRMVRSIRENEMKPLLNGEMDSLAEIKDDCKESQCLNEVETSMNQESVVPKSTQASNEAYSCDIKNYEKPVQVLAEIHEGMESETVANTNDISCSEICISMEDVNEMEQSLLKDCEVEMLNIGGISEATNLQGKYLQDREPDKDRGNATATGGGDHDVPDKDVNQKSDNDPCINTHNETNTTVEEDKKATFDHRPQDESTYKDFALSLMGFSEFDSDVKVLKHGCVYKQSVKKSIKDVAWFTLGFIVCVIPRLIYDVAKIMNKERVSLDTPVMKTLAISADTGLSILFFAFNIMFLWRFKIHQQE